MMVEVVKSGVEKLYIDPIEYSKWVDVIASGKPLPKHVSIFSCDEDGTTLAHVMCYHGAVFTDKEILKAADNNGWTIAHEMAVTGRSISDPEVLEWATNDGVKVRHILRTFGDVKTWSAVK